LRHVNNNLNCEVSYRKFAADNYNLLYNILSTRDCSGEHENSSVAVSVASPIAAVRDAMEQAIPRGHNRQVQIPCLVF
jgi:hypothetical protein